MARGIKSKTYKPHAPLDRAILREGLRFNPEMFGGFPIHPETSQPYFVNPDLDHPDSVLVLEINVDGTHNAERIGLWQPAGRA